MALDLYAPPSIYGFVYIWMDKTNKKFYVDSHKGSINDGYIGSGTKFSEFCSQAPIEIRKYREKSKSTRKIKDKLECPHCHVIMDSSNVKRYHFNNCKMK